MRVISALVLAPLAIATAYLGGAVFIVFWGLAALGILWEWRRIVGDTRAVTLGLSIAAIVLVTADLALSGAASADRDVLTVCLVALLAALVAREHRIWIAGGILYSSTLVLSVSVLRADREWGYWAILYLFAIVWATDILGYFVGRLVGGPRLAPRFSPKKTWSGAVGGVAGAVLASTAVTGYAGLSTLPAVAGLGLVLSAISQAGDLFESAVKRRFGAKDAGHVIPGHGGFMDRLDGFLAAAFAAAIIGLARGGLDAPARGLLVW
ncbi:MAG: phosphatidate cytidylyltransferase [Bradyrhizobiaceae bacterium]|nr:phosphatidate cytidylyltransferase [Bradyrhizobiaceae bacterium]